MLTIRYWLNRIIYLIRRNLFVDVIKSHLKHGNKTIYEKILPLISIADICDDTNPVLINNQFEDGNVSNYELECICKIVKNINPEALFEIGTFNGRTTLNMAMNISPEAKIYTLDLPRKSISETLLRIKSGEKIFIDKDISGAQFIGTPYEHKIIQIYADSAQFDYSGYNSTIDFVFIDGSHAYEYVLNDTKIALGLIRNGHGVILWHDYGWNEVIKALNEFYFKDERFINMKNIAGSSLVYLKL